jgi:hypothetical protein
MGKSFDDVPVYTRESVFTTGDDEKKQSIIDEWTDELACKMASNTDYTILDDGTVIWHKRDRRGGSNRQTIEMLNADGYVVKIFNSIAEVAKYFSVSEETAIRTIDGKRKTPLKPGYTLRRRETEKERQAREKANSKANKKRIKTITKNNKTKNKKNYGKK